MNNSKCVLLIVDDDAAFRDAQKRVLRHFKPPGATAMEIIDANNGEEAMELLRARAVDVVLLDHDMPGRSGLDWLKEIRAACSDVAVIMVTGRGSEQLAVEAMKRGASDYLVKGAIAPTDLHRAVVNAIQKAEMHRTIEIQGQELLAAEQQRVMIESLGAACHHLGQPATVITAYLELMRRKEESPEILEMIANCAEAAETMAQILARLDSIREYRTVPYVQQQEGMPVRSDERILQI